MKFKDFTQEAYDDIQSYMGGEEQWEEINKTYGVVETKGIFQYDYESQLRNAATEYQRQNEEASNSVRRMFDNVNGVDDLYAARFRDEYMDLERFSTAIKELAALINVRSVENIYTMDCQTLKTKAGNIQAKVDSKITEYYKERFYSVDSNGKTVMNWDEINYEMRKKFVPDAELQALVSVFPKLSTDDEEETIANIENMLRAGYGNAKDDEWIDNADLEDPKYYSVSVTNTFKRAVDIYKTSMDIIDYYSEECAYRDDEISDEALEEMKEPRIMMMHLYEKSYVLPSRKAYCDQLISLRKLFVDVIKEYWQGIDEIHRVDKAHNVKMDLACKNVCDKILNVNIELPASEINRFGLGYEKRKEEKDDGKSSKDNLKELNSLYLHYSSSLIVFFRQCYLPSQGFINDKQRMTILLLEAQGTMKKLQSLFHQVFDDYVDVIEIKQLDERESQQMLCLIVVYHWLAQNKPYMSCRQLLKQIKPMKLTTSQTDDTSDKNIENLSTAIVDTVDDIEQLRNMQLKNIYSRCSHLDDLSTQIVDKYLKRYDEAIHSHFAI